MKNRQGLFAFFLKAKMQLWSIFTTLPRCLINKSYVARDLKLHFQRNSFHLMPNTYKFFITRYTSCQNMQRKEIWKNIVTFAFYLKFAKFNLAFVFTIFCLYLLNNREFFIFSKIVSEQRQLCWRDYTNKLICFVLFSMFYVF